MIVGFDAFHASDSLSLCSSGADWVDGNCLYGVDSCGREDGGGNVGIGSLTATLVCFHVFQSNIAYILS